MKATGIVRRIDDLGRIVIPKEIRRTLRIREGDPLEIYTDRNEQIIFKKYSAIGELGLFAKQYAEALSQTSGHTICISDKDKVIAVAGGSKKELLDKEISEELIQLINDRVTITATRDLKNYVTIMEYEEDEIFASQVVAPIISEGDAVGSVIILDKDNKKMTEVEEKLCLTAAGFLGKQMEQ